MHSLPAAVELEAKEMSPNARPSAQGWEGKRVLAQGAAVWKKRQVEVKELFDRVDGPTFRQQQRGCRPRGVDRWFCAPPRFRMQQRQHHVSVSRYYSRRLIGAGP